MEIVYYDDLKKMVKGYLRRRGVQQGLMDMLAMLYGASTEVEDESLKKSETAEIITLENI